MKFALNENDEKIEVSNSGQIGKCKDCGSIVIGRKGNVRPKHWYHKTKKECDIWYEPTTEWHLKWQNYFPKENQEVTLFDLDNKNFHRADIYLKNKLVIEIQNSPINFDEISQREDFYGKNKMIWILNGENLAKKTTLKYKLKRKIFAFEISIPFYVENIPEYDMDNFSEKLLKSETLKEIFKNEKLIKFNPKKGAYFYFEFNERINLKDIEQSIYYEIKKLCHNTFSWENSKQIENQCRIDVYENPKNYYEITEFKKAYWRKFIDEMKFPVFFDNIKGL
jgi:competence protein CoiA